MSRVFQAQAPAKLILLGEWAVLKGAPCIATPLRSHFHLRCEGEACEKNTIEFHSQSQSQSIFIYKKGSNSIIDDFWKLALKILKILHDNNENKIFENYSGSKIITQCEWKLEEGLGTSSALFLTLFLIHYKKCHDIEFQNASDLWQAAYPMYKKVFTGSGADLAAQISSSPLIYQSPYISKFNCDKSAQLQLVHTGEKISSEKSINKITLSDEWIKKMKLSVENFIKNHQWASAINEHLTYLQEIGVVNREHLEFYKFLYEKKIVKAFKSTGAGGGDGLLFWLNNENELDNFKKEIEKRNWWLSPYEWGHDQAWKISEVRRES
jgi:mevalonate kinase